MDAFEFQDKHGRQIVPKFGYLVTNPGFGTAGRVVLPGFGEVVSGPGFRGLGEVVSGPGFKGRGRFAGFGASGFNVLDPSTYGQAISGGISTVESLVGGAGNKTQAIINNAVPTATGSPAASTESSDIPTPPPFPPPPPGGDAQAQAMGFASYLAWQLSNPNISGFDLCVNTRGFGPFSSISPGVSTAGAGVCASGTCTGRVNSCNAAQWAGMFAAASYGAPSSTPPPPPSSTPPPQTGFPPPSKTSSNGWMGAQPGIAAPPPAASGNTMLYIGGAALALAVVAFAMKKKG